jgi:hypothetical protein
MATLAQFRSQFPEMRTVSDPLAAAMLGAAALELDLSVWGPYGVDGVSQTKADQAQMYLAAHKLAISPYGQAAKMVMDKRSGYDRTTYGAEFKSLMRGVVWPVGVA